MAHFVWTTLPNSYYCEFQGIFCNFYLVQGLLCNMVKREGFFL